MSSNHIDHYEYHHREEMGDSALNVTDGVESQPIVNPYFKRVKRRTLSTEEYVKGILEGNITILSQAITLIESNNRDHYAQAQEIIEKCLPYSGKSMRIGITGVPGAGKSTFIEAVGGMVTELGHKLAVLAIETICNNPKVFIRPSPSAGSLGGVARKTRESIVLCEAAGFDVVFVETVGVGQSETAVHSMVDIFMLLQISGAGDELQGIKRGIMEMADVVAITKADGDNRHRAELARAQIFNALKLFPLTDSKWAPQVLTCSSLTGKGIGDVWNTVEDFIRHTKENGFFRSNRNRQSKYWMYESINESLKAGFYNNPAIASRLGDYEDAVLSDRISSFIAAKELLDLYYTKEG